MHTHTRALFNKHKRNAAFDRRGRDRAREKMNNISAGKKVDRKGKENKNHKLCIEKAKTINPYVCVKQRSTVCRGLYPYWIY